MPIRWRLTLWFSLILLAILVLSGAVLYVMLERYLYNEIDDSLKTHSACVHGTLSPEQVPDPLDYNVIHSRLPPVNEFTSPGTYIQFIDREGRVVVKSDNLGEQELPVAPALVGEGFEGAAIGTVAAGQGARVRVMVSPMYLRDQTLVLEVARSLATLDATMSQVRWALLGGILLSLVLAGITGGITVRRALSPVERITKTARSIEESSDLTRRVGYGGVMDEVGQLATTFDRMIERLNRVFELQKQFIADASHELRSPLTVIQGNLDLLKRNISEDDRRESLRAIESEAKRMTNIVSDLLMLAEIESGYAGHQEAVSLREVVLEEFERAKTLAVNRQVIIGRLEDLSVRGDGYRLRQALANLVDNAVKYTPEGGAITISLFGDGGWTRLEVADTGIGISPENLPRIFDRFYRADKSRSRTGGGTGLGLAIVKGIAEKHSGRATVSSEPGRGSTFTLWLKL